MREVERGERVGEGEHNDEEEVDRRFRPRMTKPSTGTIVPLSSSIPPARSTSSQYVRNARTEGKTLKGVGIIPHSVANA